MIHHDAHWPAEAALDRVLHSGDPSLRCPAPARYHRGWITELVVGEVLYDIAWGHHLIQIPLVTRVTNDELPCF